jgi:GNAT superfamily N-acetyltransferase
VPGQSQCSSNLRIVANPPTVDDASISLQPPAGVSIRAWREVDLPAIQRLSDAEGWPTSSKRAEAYLAAWRHSCPALVATSGDRVIGFLRALTDGTVTTYVAEVLVARDLRGKGVGRALLDTCQALYPDTRLDLLSTDEADGIYEACGFRGFPGFRRSRAQGSEGPAELSCLCTKT